MFTEQQAAALYKKGYRASVITDTRAPSIVSHHKSEIGALTKVVKGSGLWLMWLKEDGFVQCGFGNMEEVRLHLADLRREARR